jgi:hypothetical protein
MDDKQADQAQERDRQTPKSSLEALDQYEAFMQTLRSDPHFRIDRSTGEGLVITGQNPQHPKPQRGGE